MANPSFRINIIGRGNVATHLHKAFNSVSGIEANIVNPHTLAELDENADFTIISVSDNAITDVANKIAGITSLVAHTSGSTSIEALANIKGAKGVFYPFQTFSKDKELDYSQIPFFIEGNNETSEKLLIELASKISNNVNKADSAKRKSIHVAGVFACNFANHLWSIADSILDKQGVNFNVLRPLIKETFEKTSKMPPAQGQTGPAIRHDTKTIESHIRFLKENNTSEDVINIYRLLTDSIMKSYPQNSQD